MAAKQFISKEVKQIVIERYNNGNGLSTWQLAEEHGICQSSVQKILRTSGAIMRSRGGYHPRNPEPELELELEPTPVLTSSPADWSLYSPHLSRSQRIDNQHRSRE